jgi:hypothetical protein
MSFFENLHTVDKQINGSFDLNPHTAGIVRVCRRLLLTNLSKEGLQKASFKVLFASTCIL